MRHGVGAVVDEDESDDGASGTRVLGLGIGSADGGPAGEEDGHADEGHNVLLAAGHFAGEEGAVKTSDEVPAVCCSSVSCSSLGKRGVGARKTYHVSPRLILFRVL